MSIWCIVAPDYTITSSDKHIMIALLITLFITISSFILSDFTDLEYIEYKMNSVSAKLVKTREKCKTTKFSAQCFVDVIQLEHDSINYQIKLTEEMSKQIEKLTK